MNITQTNFGVNEKGVRKMRRVSLGTLVIIMFLLSFSAFCYAENTQPRMFEQEQFVNVWSNNQDAPGTSYWNRQKPGNLPLVWNLSENMVPLNGAK